MASSVWKGHLTFGLVSFPVRLFSAARGGDRELQSVARNRQFAHQADDLLPGGRQTIPRSEIVKGYEYEKDHYVVIDDEDIKKVAPKTAKVMEIQEFVKGDRRGSGLPGELLLHGAGRGRREAVRAAVRGHAPVRTTTRVAKIAMHNREHVIILRPGNKGILLHTMYYVDEIRQVDEFRTEHRPGEAERTGTGRST